MKTQCWPSCSVAATTSSKMRADDFSSIEMANTSGLCCFQLSYGLKMNQFRFINILLNRLQIKPNHRYILNFIRSNDLPPENVALDVLKEAEFFCMTTLIEKLEALAPKVISLRRREYFRQLIPDYEQIKNKIIIKATEKKTCFEESRVVITQSDHPKLKGQIPCYNCTREFVSVNHSCVFEGLPNDITISLKTMDIDMDKLVGFVVDELAHDGFRVICSRVICKFSLRCQGCTLSGLYTAGKHLT